MNQIDSDSLLLIGMHAPSPQFDSLISNLTAISYRNTQIIDTCSFENAWSAYYYYGANSLTLTPQNIYLGVLYNVILDSIQTTTTPKDINYCNRIYDAISFCSNDALFLDISSAFNALTDSLNNIKNEMSSETWEINEQYSLIMLSVAQHSCDFWKNYFLNPPSKYPLERSKFSNIQKAADMTAREVAIVGADCVGALHGGYKGAVSGSITGGVLGGLVGGLGGAVVGAFTYSAGMATIIEIWSAWHSYFEVTLIIFIFLNSSKSI